MRSFVLVLIAFLLAAALAVLLHWLVPSPPVPRDALGYPCPSECPVPGQPAPPVRSPGDRAILAPSQK